VAERPRVFFDASALIAASRIRRAHEPLSPDDGMGGHKTLRMMAWALRHPGLGIALELSQEQLLEVTQDGLMAPRQEVPQLRLEVDPRP